MSYATSLLTALALVAGCNRDSFTETDDTQPDDTQVVPECETDDQCSTHYICEAEECVRGDRDNTFQDATPILQNQRIDGVIEPAGDLDFYAYDSPGGEWLRVETTSPDEEDSLDTVLSVYASTGALHLVMDDYATGSVTTYDSLAYVYLPTAGTWYVRVEDRSTWYDEDPRGGEDFAYTLELKTFTALTREADASTDPSVTVDVTSGTSIWAVGVNLEEPGDSDWIEVTLPWGDAPLELYGVASAPGSELDVLARVYDPAGDLVLEKEGLGPEGEASYFNAEGVSYLVEITDARGGGGDDHWASVYLRTRENGTTYGMELEPNDTAETAGVLAGTISEADAGLYTWYSFQGALGAEGDVDWYTFDLESTDYLSVLCSADSYGALGDLAVEVFAPDGASLGEYSDSDSDTTPDVYNLEPAQTGAATLVVRSEDGTYGPGAYYRCLVLATPFRVAE